MKQLRKIQLKDAVVISDSEMRQIRGGATEPTTGITCNINGTNDGCVDTTSTCYVGSLKGTCVWITGINPDTQKPAGGCACRWTNPN